MLGLAGRGGWSAAGGSSTLRGGNRDRQGTWHVAKEVASDVVSAHRCQTGDPLFSKTWSASVPRSFSVLLQILRLPLVARALVPHDDVLELAEVLHKKGPGVGALESDARPPVAALVVQEVVVVLHAQAVAEARLAERVPAHEPGRGVGADGAVAVAPQRRVRGLRVRDQQRGEGCAGQRHNLRELAGRASGAAALNSAPIAP